MAPTLGPVTACRVSAVPRHPLGMQQSLLWCQRYEHGCRTPVQTNCPPARMNIFMGPWRGNPRQVPYYRGVKGSCIPCISGCQLPQPLLIFSSLDPPPPLQMPFSRISSFFGIYFPIILLFPQVFCFAVSAGKYQPAPFTFLSSSQSPPPIALENFSSSVVPKVSAPSYVGSTYPCMREAICTGLVSHHAEAQLCRRRKSPALAELLPGFPLLFPVANKRGVNAPAEHCRRGVNVISIKSRGPSLSSSCLFPAHLPPCIFSHPWYLQLCT